MQLMLIRSFGWSLAEIDRTDVVSLFDLVRHVSVKGTQKELFDEDVNW